MLTREPLQRRADRLADVSLVGHKFVGHKFVGQKRAEPPLSSTNRHESRQGSIDTRGDRERVEIDRRGDRKRELR